MFTFYVRYDTYYARTREQQGVTLVDITFIRSSWQFHFDENRSENDLQWNET